MGEAQARADETHLVDDWISRGVWLAARGYITDYTLAQHPDAWITIGFTNRIDEEKRR